MDLWDMFFMQMASWRLHPGYLREGAKAPSLEEIAEVVNQMMKVREQLKCQSQQPQ